ncbi:hypothetical protein [Dyadobacter sp. 3J3]|uniref:hypothetical protein n=1 Tax=Dyadobacter sp. 3J3 TaxID=2606600 RepID=UPI00135CB8F8|nr:hypothetical protein [Dyadobacter sp. 3J3]
MITVDSYNLHFDTTHLLKPKPENFEEVIARIKPIKCDLFYNIISDPTCGYEKKFSEGRIKEHYKNMGAEARFKNIFEEKIIYSNPKSYFVNKLATLLPSECNEIKSVSFTFCGHKELKRHFVARGSEFGICFFHDFLQDRGIRPVFYLNDSDTEMKKRMVFNSPHLLEVYKKGYDMRWEKEWRIGSDLHFTQNDIAFVIVPQEKHEYYVNWFSEIVEFEDIQIITSNTYKSPIDHLIFYPQQTNNSWDQIEIFRDNDIRGFKIDPDLFNELDYFKKMRFSDNQIEKLDCLAKNTIILNYEYAYVNKFLEFAKKVAGLENINELFADYDSIASNIQEAVDTQRDLIISLFEELFRRCAPNVD